MAYADYTFYTETYKGKSIPEADFDRLVTRSSSYLDRYGRESRSGQRQRSDGRLRRC